MALEDSVYHCLFSLSQHMYDEMKWWPPEYGYSDDPLIDELAELFEILQRVINISDQQVKEIIYAFCYRPGEREAKLWQQLVSSR
jgi:hypothetical protein